MTYDQATEELSPEALMVVDYRVARLLDAAKAYRDLATCYRVGKQPSETLFKRLEKAGKVVGE